jgi:hypothetical protein
MDCSSLRRLWRSVLDLLNDASSQREKESGVSGLTFVRLRVTG